MALFLESVSITVDRHNHPRLLITNLKTRKRFDSTPNPFKLLFNSTAEKDVISTHHTPLSQTTSLNLNSHQYYSRLRYA